jgi:predicted DCC family thiol-disulfide oxidoreductase YuxK
LKARQAKAKAEIKKTGAPMTTAVKTSGKTLVYDGDCPMCNATVGLLLRLKLLRREQARSNHDLSGDDLESVRAAGIRNQLVVLDPQTRETRSGADGILWILSENTGNHLAIRLLGLPGVRHLLRWGYQIVSYNRRVISTPRQQIVCDCEPEVTLARRLALVVPTLVLTVLMTALFGAAVFYGWQLGDAPSGAVFMCVAAGSGWVALVAAALVLLRGEQRIDYVAHLVVTMFVGVLVLIPASLLALVLPRPVLIVLDGLSVLASFSLMFAMQRRRVAAIGLSNRWLWAWVIALAVGFGGTVAFYS